MNSTIVITIVVIAAIGWLAFLAVSALRSRGPEEIPANLTPGDTDDELETRRIERAQQAAVLLSAFLAVGLPLYYLGENQRQESFVEQFHEESVERGEHLVEEFACYDCHGPGGSGGVASFVEKRTGVTVEWEAPPLNDIFYRYGREEVRHWITFGRSNTPMPAWGLEGGGPMNEAQVEDIINFLEEHQISQAEAVAAAEQRVSFELGRLDSAEETMVQRILRQRQVIAELERSPEMVDIAEELAERARQIEATMGDGLDTDGDGVSDAAEVAISELTAEAKDRLLPEGLEELSFDPADPETHGRGDREVVEEVLATMRRLIDEGVAPILSTYADAIGEALEAEGEDTDGDGIPDEAESQISAQISSAVNELLPAELVVVNLDPTNPESQGGQSDRATARRALSGLQSIALTLRVQADNLDRSLPPAREGLETLLEFQEAKRWEFDFEGIAADAFGGDTEKARRVVGIYQANCARCHTAGKAAGIPFSAEPGSGGFGPALWEGRPAVQFLSDDDLKSFLISGAVANQPYGVNGMGSGRMPAFGMMLSEQDLEDLARWLRSGNLNGIEGSGS